MILSCLLCCVLRTDVRLDVEHDMPYEDVMYACVVLLQQWNRVQKEIGQRMLFMLSRAGYAEATLRIMNHALIQDRSTRPGTLRSSSVIYSRGHLQKLARAGENYRAMVLEGKIALHIGDEAYAINMWQQAMAAAVHESEAIRSKRKADNPKDENFKDLEDLDSPWIELGLLYHDRSKRGVADEWQLARDAFKIGTEQDDPVAYFNSAVLALGDAYGNYTSYWLYAMTKAASSGHAKAMHELGVYYATTVWPFIEDEPPDEQKPTPFDRFPPSTQSSAPGLWDRLKTLVVPNPTSKDAKDHIFHTAIFPDNPAERRKLAVDWFTEAAALTYAPALLWLSKVRLEEELWPEAAVPKAALQMTPARYTHASREASELAQTQPPPSDPETAPGIPNPFYDPSKAQENLKEVFNMFLERQTRKNALARGVLIAGKLKSDPSKWIEDSAEVLIEDMPEHLNIWTAYPEVRDMYAHEVEGLVREASQICDEREWDLYDDEGGLLYYYSRGEGK